MIYDLHASIKVQAAVKNGSSHSLSFSVLHCIVNNREYQRVHCNVHNREYQRIHCMQRTQQRVSASSL